MRTTLISMLTERTYFRISVGAYIVPSLNFSQLPVCKSLNQCDHDPGPEIGCKQGVHTKRKSHFLIY